MSIRHGTLSGYLYRDCRCAPCTRAKRVYQRELRAGIRRPLVDATETRQHLQALRAQGWTYTALAARTGYHVDTITNLEKGITRHARQATVEDLLSIPIRKTA